MKKRLKCFIYAGKGVQNLFKKEPNALVHALAMILVILVGFAFNISKTEWLIVIFCIGAVFTAETFNSAIERVVDLVSPDHHKLAGEAKDLAAGAVLICAITAAIIGIIIFVPKILYFFTN